MSNHIREINGWIGIWLAGISGSGKTTLGRELSLHLGCPLFDSDDFASDLVGKTPSELADFMLIASGMPRFIVWASLGFPTNSTKIMRIGLYCPARTAIRRKPQGYGSWLGQGSGGQVLDTWQGLHDAYAILDATLPTYQLASVIMDKL